MLNIEERLKRDKCIVNDYLAGMAVVMIVAKHTIDSQQIYKILRREGINPNRYSRATK